MAANQWRMKGLQLHGDGGLALTTLQLWGEEGRVDVGAAVSASHAPSEGVISNLTDGDPDTECKWPAHVVKQPGFQITWVMTTPVDAWCARFQGGDAQAAIAEYTLEYFNGTTWVGCRNGWLPYSTELSPLRTEQPIYGVSPDWTEHSGLAAGTSGFNGVSCDSTGMTTLVVGQGDTSSKVLLSKNWGLTWSYVTGPTPGTRGFTEAAVSANGQVLGCTGFGTSAAQLSLSHDGGVSWTQVSGVEASSEGLIGLGVSADGQTIAVAGIGNTSAKVSISEDGGATWVQAVGLTPGDRGFGGVAVSASGATIVVTTRGSTNPGVFISHNKGVSWSQVAGATGAAVGSAGALRPKVSANGQTVVVAGFGNATSRVSISHDGGVTWNRPSVVQPGSSGFNGVALDASGQKIAVGTAGTTTPELWVSSDGGATWVKDLTPTPGTSGFSGATFSSDGVFLMAAGQGSSGSSLVSKLTAPPVYGSRPVTQIHTPLVVAAKGAAPLYQNPPNVGYAENIPLQDLEFGGNGRIHGTVKRKNDPVNVPLRRRVRLHRSRDGLLARETWSREDGTYEFNSINPQYEYDAVSWDHEMTYRTVVANNLKPEVAGG